jgi:hypothetical protein
MSIINDGGSAFPVPEPGVETGLTVRDYFAAAALPALIDAAKFERFDLTVGMVRKACDDAAMRSYQIADAMLRARGAA